MMYNGGNFPFYEDKLLGVKILALPYKGLEVISENNISTLENVNYIATLI